MSWWPTGRPAGRTRGRASFSVTELPLPLQATGHHKHHSSVGVSSDPRPALCTGSEPRSAHPAPHILWLLCPRSPHCGHACLRCAGQTSTCTHPSSVARTAPEQSEPLGEPQTHSRTPITSALVSLEKGFFILSPAPPCCLCQLQRSRERANSHTLTHSRTYSHYCVDCGGQNDKHDNHKITAGEDHATNCVSIHVSQPQ